MKRYGVFAVRRKRSERKSSDVAGAAGLEPANGGVKVRCVTASPRPYVVLLRLMASVPRKREISLHSARRPLRVTNASLVCAAKKLGAFTSQGKEQRDWDFSQSRRLWGG